MRCLCKALSCALCGLLEGSKSRKVTEAAAAARKKQMDPQLKTNCARTGLATPTRSRTISSRKNIGEVPNPNRKTEKQAKGKPPG